MDEITQEMVEEFNQILIAEGSIVRLKKVGFYAVNIIVDDPYIKDFVLVMTKEFYNKLIEFFEKKGVKLRFNNTLSTFWKDK